MNCKLDSVYTSLSMATRADIDLSRNLGFFKSLLPLLYAQGEVPENFSKAWLSCGFDPQQLSVGIGNVDSVHKAIVCERGEYAIFNANRGGHHHLPMSECEKRKLVECNNHNKRVKL